MWQQFKQRLKSILAAFAQRKAQDQAQGMETEARGIVASTKDLARRNPAGLALLALLGAGLLLLKLRSQREARSV